MSSQSGSVLGDCSIPLPSGRAMRGAMAVPSRDGLHPGMVVLHEMFGLNDEMRRITRRWADEGFVAVAPDMYSYGHKALCLTKVLLDGVTWNEKGALAHIESARQFLADRDDVAESRIGVVGYCLGGGFALAFATKGKVGAAGVNYGAVPKDRKRLQGVCPVVASYGGQDRLFAKQAARLEEHLSALGVPHDVKVYEDAGHSFLSENSVPAWMARIPLPDPMRVGFNPEAAEDAWRRTLEFFAKYLS